MTTLSPIARSEAISLRLPRAAEGSPLKDGRVMRFI